MGRTQLSVILMILCAIKCLAVSYDELEDFAEYLQRTSQLSPILKKGVEYDDDDALDKDDDDAWEESGKFEGDLILNERQRRLIVESVAEGLSRNGIRDGTKRWPNNEVIYFIQVEHFKRDQVQAIHDAIDELQRASCIKFRPYRKGDPDAVVIQGSRKGCFSQVGYQGGYQVLNLSGRHPNGRGCFRHGTIVHELLHTLGFYHMQSSPVRDDYVDIIWDNIVQAARHNFRKYNSFSVSNFGVTYDYDSVLHYSKHAFSVNGQDTIVPKKKGAVIGQRIGLSEKDTLKLNKMYCDADSDEEQENNKNKKKVTKKKPKLIQGIGYHQGKAVVFKVPTAMPYKLNEKPSPYAFNHFSKAPQILPSPKNEEYRPNKDMMYYYKASEQSDKYHEPAYNNNELQKMYQGSVPLPANQQQTANGVENTDQDKMKKGIEKLYYENAQVATLHNSDDKIQEPVFIEAIDRLSKIIKAHVYPSHTPDLSIYKMNQKQNYRVDNRENEKEVKKNHVELVLISPTKKEALKPVNMQTLQAEKMDSAVRFINKLYNVNEYPPYEALYDRYRLPTKDDYYKDDRQIQNNEGKRPQNAQDITFVDPSYPKSYSEDYDEFYSPMRYKVDGDDDEYENYTSKQLDGEKSSKNHDDCSRNIYVEYGNGAVPDYYSQRSSQDPARLLRYLYIPDTYSSDNSNDRSDLEYYS